MKRKSKYRMVAAVALITAICIALPQPVPLVTGSYADGPAPTGIELGSTNKDGYDQYLARYAQAARPERELTIPGDRFSNAEGMQINVVDGVDGASGKAIETGESGIVSWELDVQDEGLYNIELRFRPMEGKGSDIDRELNIDGKLPFAEAKNLVFRRLWKNNGAAVRDDNGNDMYTPQAEVPIWQEVFVQSSDGRHGEPYSFYFSKGKHVISLVSAKEPMMIDYIKLRQTDKVPSYRDLSEHYKRQGYKEASGAMVKVQGEAAGIKSSAVLYPMMDRSSPAVEPYDVSKIRLNTIGSFNWSEAGQWVSWDIEVPEDGLYKIGVKYNQSLQRGVTSYRKLMIDGKVPFSEMESVAFDFSSDWQMKEIGDGEEPYLFYLTKGKHVLRMDVTLGEMALYLRSIESSVLELNTIYRRIVMVTGTVPDEYRDYQLDLKLPEMTGLFRKQADLIASIAARIEKTTGGSSDRTATLNRIVYQLRDMADNPDTVTRRLETFKSNISSLGSWIFSVNYMPLSVDYIVVASPEQKMPRASATAWGNIKHQAGTFLLSFFNDYNALGSSKGKDGDKIKVWITMGLDQAKIVKRMIEETFTPVTGVAVDLQVVTEAVLLQAMLAGRGPDVAFSVANDKPLNYALRSGVEDLSKYPGFDEVKKQFSDSAFVPYSFNGGVYALPSDQYFPVLFYRKDILEEMKLEVPQTWDDVYAMVPELQKQNLIFGFPIQVLVKTGSNVQDSANLPVNFTFGTMLYQADGELYTKDGKASALDSEESVKSFIQWSELYTTYKLPLETDFTNRFRSGEMPIGIADYTRFNIISVVAPELKGLWDFTLTPGTRLPDGSIRRDVPAYGSGAVMLKSSKHKENAWKFMQWWASSKVQAKYGLENEAIFGPAGRYATANIQAVEQLPWQVKDYKTLMEQWKWVKGVPEVPGGYFTGRHLDNAFRSVVISNEDPREAIDNYTRYINDEIKKKRKEFGLPND
ncbi:extracellular solute-binding protein [Paenibacillus spongiae]|uniref:Extracellular solute-binding protein n=1 Tax=Paenibacillus spongiae TaxID=2909671 RepID=A0ABY5SBN0_9BACL|nr:extracellular solute-binding protein [Paenibacillus spongiae]UVI30160.1 extracellular solute-binding protein [Paenibacillus spongiae]